MSLINRRWLLQGAPCGLLRSQALANPTVRLGRSVRLGLIGVTGHAAELLRAIANLPDVVVVGYSDPSPEALAAAGRRPQLATARAYRDYSEMLDSEKIDVVQICGDNGSRSAAIVACATRGIHIIAEKPLATEHRDLERVVRAVAKHNVKATMLLPMRFYPSYLAMKQLVHSGLIGDVAQVDSQKSYQFGKQRPDWMFQRSSYGGTIPWAGAHMVDLMRWTSGREFRQVAAFHGRVGFPERKEMENAAAALFHMDNSGVAVLRLDYLRPEGAVTHGDDRLRLVGTKGVLEYRVESGLNLIPAIGKPEMIEELPAVRSLFVEFFEWIYNNKPAPIEWADACRVSELVLAARDAADTETMISL